MTVKESMGIYNYMRRNADFEDYFALHNKSLLDKILSKELPVYDAEHHSDTTIEYDTGTVQLHLEQFTRIPFRMNRYGTLVVTSTCSESFE